MPVSAGKNSTRAANGDRAVGSEETNEEVRQQQGFMAEELEQLKQIFRASEMLPEFPMLCRL